MAGLTTRTLRYYDQVNLLSPSRNEETGYRSYSSTDVAKLQRILFYRALDFDLKTIKQLLVEEKPTIHQQLLDQKHRLEEKRTYFDQLINTIDATIKDIEGEQTMTDTEKLMAFKQKQVEQNEAKYGHEIREQYGDETINQANQQFMNLSSEDLEEMNNTETKLFDAIKNALNGPVTSEQKHTIFQLHKNWLSYTMPNYSLVIHQNISQMYMDDERFGKYYESKVGKAGLNILYDAIQNAKE